MSERVTCSIVRMADTLRERVRRERETSRGWSYRQAGEAGGISGETWRRFEGGGSLTKPIRRAVAQAFGWSMDWPEQVTARRKPRPSQLADDGVDYRAFVTSAAMIGATNNALLDTLNEKVDRVIDLLLRMQDSGGHRARRERDAAL